MSENEIGPGVLQSSVWKTRVLQKYQRHKPRATDSVLILSVLCEIMHILCLLNTGSEHSGFDLIFEMRDNFIFGILY